MKKFKLMWFNDTDQPQKVKFDTLDYTLGTVKPHDCEIFELDLDEERPGLYVKIWPSGIVLVAQPFEFKSKQRN